MKKAALIGGFLVFSGQRCDDVPNFHNLVVFMPVFKAICPVCHGSKTTIRTSKRITPAYQVLYCDCLDENCLTRFKVDSTHAGVIHTMHGNTAAGFKMNSNQLDLAL